MLYVDKRWVGRSGIARFSEEVLKRASFEYRVLPGGGNPAAPNDVFNKARLSLQSTDLVYTPGFNCGFSRARQVLTLHDLIHLEDRNEATVLKRAYYERIVRPTVRAAGTVMTVSEVSGDRIRDWLQDASIRIVNVGNGCSSAFTYGEGHRSNNNFLYVGTAKPHKNLRVVLQALQKRPDLTLRIVCSDPDAVGRMVTQFRVESQVAVMSGLTDRQLADEYRKSRGLVFPSTLEGFGLPALEAIRCGSRVLYWEGCESVAEIVKDSGIAVSASTDPDVWISAMETAIDKGSALSEEQVKVLTERYNWDDVATRVSRVVNQELSNAHS